MEERKRIRCERPIRTAEGSNASCWMLFSGKVKRQKRTKDVREQFAYVNQFIARRPLGTRPAPLRLQALPRGPHQQK